MLHLSPTNLLLLTAKQEPYRKKSLSLNEKYKIQENGPAGRKKKKKAERVIGIGRRTREKIVKWDQMTALRFQTGETSDIPGLNSRFPKGSAYEDIELNGTSPTTMPSQQDEYPALGASDTYVTANREGEPPPSGDSVADENSSIYATVNKKKKKSPLSVPGPPRDKAEPDVEQSLPEPSQRNRHERQGRVKVN